MHIWFQLQATRNSDPCGYIIIIMIITIVAQKTSSITNISKTYSMLLFLIFVDPKKQNKKKYSKLKNVKICHNESIFSLTIFQFPSSHIFSNNLFAEKIHLKDVFNQKQARDGSRGVPKGGRRVKWLTFIKRKTLWKFEHTCVKWKLQNFYLLKTVMYFFVSCIQSK